MKKLILLATALLVAGQASAYAQGERTGRHHKHLMSSHAQMRGPDGGFYYRDRGYYAPPVSAYPSAPNDYPYISSHPTSEGG